MRINTTDSLTLENTNDRMMLIAEEFILPVIFIMMLS